LKIVYYLLKIKEVQVEEAPKKVEEEVPKQVDINHVQELTQKDVNPTQLLKYKDV
jgi:hypothetical protein